MIMEGLGLFCLLHRVAFAGQGTVRAVAAAGTLARLLIAHHASNGQRHQNYYKRDDQDVSPVV